MAKWGQSRSSKIEATRSAGLPWDLRDDGFAGAVFPDPNLLVGASWHEFLFKSFHLDGARRAIALNLDKKNMRFIPSNDVEWPVAGGASTCCVADGF